MNVAPAPKLDGDTGYGEALNVIYVVGAFEEAGAGLAHREDQLLPKKCGHRSAQERLRAASGSSLQ